YSLFLIGNAGDHRHLLSFLHDALPISHQRRGARERAARGGLERSCRIESGRRISPPERGAPAGAFVSVQLRLRRLRRDDRGVARSEEHTSELQSLAYIVCRLLLEKKQP